MNRIFSAFTAILLTLSLTACGAAKDNNAAPADDPSAAARMLRSASVSPAPLTRTFGRLPRRNWRRKGSIWNLSSSRISLCLTTP